MKMRLIVAAVLVPLILVMILVAPTILTAIVLGVLCAIAAFDLMAGTGLSKNLRLVCYTGAMAFFIPMWCHFGMPHIWMVLALSIFTMLLFSELLISKGRFRLERLSVCFIAGLLIPYMLSALVRLMNHDIGRLLIMIPLVVAFLADSGAYFIGKFFGRHKLSPTISPNKTIEGAVGGIFTAILAMLIFCLVLDLSVDVTVNYALAITYGIIGSLASIFGDLCFSAIKRQTGIKDYGNLLPGHGGILDRCDSLFIVAPIIEILMAFLPVVE